MGAKTKTVGGGTATPVANEFNNFLMSQLTGGTGPNAQQQAQLDWASGLAQKGGVLGGLGQQMQNEINRQISNTSQPNQQSSGFMNAFNSALGGNVNDQSGASAALQNFFQNQGQYNLPQFGNTFQAPEFNPANISQLPTGFGAGQTGMANLGQFGNAAQSGFNAGPLTSAFSQGLQSLMNQGASQLNQGGGFNAAQNGAAVNMTPQMSYSDAYNTLGQDPLLERNRMKAIADMRARFGAEGAGALGTGAQFAEGNLNAELAAQDASQRRAQAMQLMGQDLAGNQALANVGLQNRGQDMQTAIANMQGGLQGNQNQTALLNQLLGAAGQARGQDLSTGLGQQQLMGQQSMFNAGQQNDMQTALMNAMLQNQSMGNSFGLNAAQLNNAAMQSNNANALNQNQFQNTFNQNNAQLGAQYGLGANQLNSQNQAQNQQMFQNMIGQGLNLNQLGNQNTMNMLSQLFSGFGQTNALGTPQAQIIQQPSAFGQLANAGLGLAGSWLSGGGGFGGLFGGGVPQMPNVNVPIVNNPFPRPQLFG